MSLLPIPRPDLEAWLLRELTRSRLRVAELQHLHPDADKAELSRRLIDLAKDRAATRGMVAGLFGWMSIPADVAQVAWMRLCLAIDLAVLHGVNLKSRSGRAELFDLLGIEGGEPNLRNLAKTTPRWMRSATSSMVKRMGWRTIGRTIPILAVPISAWVNGKDIEQMGRDALRRFDTFRRAPAAASTQRD